MLPLKRTSRILLFFILLVGFLLRVQNVNQPYTDIYSLRQCSTAMMAENFYKGNWNILYPQVNWSGPGPSYQGREFQTVTYLSALLYTVFGEQDWIGRTVVMLFGLWGIFALFQLVRRVWDEEHALAAAALMAITPFSVFMERSFLPDAAMVSLGITSLWLFVSYLQNDKKSRLLMSMIIGCLAFLTKIPGMLLGLPMLFAAISILRYRGELTIARIANLTLVAVIMVTPVMAYYLWARYLSLTYPPYHFAGSGNWLWDLGLTYMIKKKFFLKMFVLEYIPSLWSIPIFALAFVGLLSFPPASLYAIKKAKKDLLHPAWLFHAYLLGCLFYYFIGAEELRWNPWNFHIFSPCICVFAGRGLLIVGKLKVVNKKSFYLRVAVLLFLVLINGYFLLKDLYDPKGHIVNYKMGLALRQVRKPGELVVTIAQDLANPMSIYYSRSKGWVFPPTINNQVPLDLWPSLQSIKALNSLRAQGAKWFAIAKLQYGVIQVKYPEFASYLTAHYKRYVETPEFVIFDLRKEDK